MFTTKMYIERRRRCAVEVTIKPLQDRKYLPSYVNERTIDFGNKQLVQQDKQLNLFTGMGKKGITIEDVRYLGGNIRKEIDRYDFVTVNIDFNQLAGPCTELSKGEVVTSFIEGWHLAGYQFLKYKQAERKVEPQLSWEGEELADLVEKGVIRANAVNVARDLCNEPANKLTPTIYAKRLVELFEQTSVEVTIIDTENLRQHGFEATAIVGKGSSNPAKVAILTYKNSPDAPTALVGKGVTFDSGGTNVKTGHDIGEMKMDMGGSAAVVGAVKMLSDLQAAVHVVAVIPLVTNVAGANAFLPSDVITYRNGLTVEVGNTDAEGRLILADGILYAKSIGANKIIDIATLTGTIGQALGLKVAGIFTNNEQSMWKYKQLGERTGDYVWPMPLINDYYHYLKSNTADINNMSSSMFGGAITAALFLQKFIDADIEWIHIDMANTVRPWKEEGYYVAGASGFGVRLLNEIVKDLAI